MVCELTQTLNIALSFQPGERGRTEASPWQEILLTCSDFRAQSVSLPGNNNFVGNVSVSGANVLLNTANLLKLKALTVENDATLISKSIQLTGNLPTRTTVARVAQ